MKFRVYHKGTGIDLDPMDLALNFINYGEVVEAVFNLNSDGELSVVWHDDLGYDNFEDLDLNVYGVGLLQV